MTWAQAAQAVAQVPAIDESSAISIGLLLAIIGATAYLSRVLGRTEEQLRGINEHLANLRDMPSRLAVVENHIRSLEEDVNNLWAAYRQQDEPRRERGPRLSNPERR